MWHRPTPKELSRLPGLYDTEHIPFDNKIIHQHYFLGGSDWYMAEYSPNERVFFGYTILNGDRQNAEWGYISLDELVDINIEGFEVDRNLFWQPTRFKDIEK